MEENNRGRVISSIRERYIIRRGSEEMKGVLSGSLRFQAEGDSLLPAVGDTVEFTENGGLAVITGILPRRTVISRKVAGVTTEEQAIAANIDYAAIVMGLDGGRNFNVRSIERYLTIAWNSGALPLLLLNKADLCEDPDIFRAEAEEAAPGVEILVTSATGGQGMEQLKQMISPDKTIVLIGPSGVGKSALTNLLLGNEMSATGNTRESDKRGRHTTTASRLFDVPGGGYIIDSPGLREVQLWGEDDDVDSVFEEISALAEQCKFRDCSHQGEPGCAVQEALNSGTLDVMRYQSYLDLKREMRYLESKQDERAKYNERARQKKFGKMVKEIKTNKEIY